MEWDAVRIIIAVEVDSMEAAAVLHCTIMRYVHADHVPTIRYVPKIFPIIVTCV